MRRKEIIILCVACLVSLGVYLTYSHWLRGPGLPLDDAWIHQTYAKNLAQSGRWEFQRGMNSGGSTGPVWGFLLSIFHVFSFSPLTGAYILGYLSLLGVVMIGSLVVRRMMPEKEPFPILAGILLAFEWHLVWAAGSGMETLLFSLFALMILYFLLEPQFNYFVLGLLVGGSIWVRPGGVTLLGPVLFVLVIREGGTKLFREGLRFLLGFGLILIPYLLFNLQVANDILPNTFYAKQKEYAVLREQPILQRLGRLTLQPLVGMGIVLLPGFILEIARRFKDKRWTVFAGPLWALGYIGVYALRLPVTYQHGRYLIPVMPVFYIWGLVGLVRWLDWKEGGKVKRWVRLTWLGVLLGVTLLFWGMGASAYAKDVAIIETEMVRTAHWVAKNTDQEAVIAAHDIGALGYYSNRELIDMAGLVSPDVIPFIRDEEQLAEYLDENGADYLVTFPGWYPRLVMRGEKVYQTGGKYAPRSGGENMAVYDWRHIESE